jgi:hypothetical protein
MIGPQRQRSENIVFLSPKNELFIAYVNSFDCRFEKDTGAIKTPQRDHKQ